MMKRGPTIPISAMLFFFFSSAILLAADADQLVKDSFTYMRGKSSISTVIMTIQRPSWNRQLIIKAWTRGQKESLFYIQAPPKDFGNGTLKKGGDVCMYNPKINRIIKIPPSAMSQSWMGSDFSNNDLAKSDSLLTDYMHALIGTEMHEGKRVYLIESFPKPDAPVVWGKQTLRIREDLIWLSQTFYDENLQPVKTLSTGDIQMIGGKMYPKAWRMRKVDQIDHYTDLTYISLEFDASLPDDLFTLSSLRHAKSWQKDRP